jgi:hypothetical protein
MVCFSLNIFNWLSHETNASQAVTTIPDGDVYDYNELEIPAPHYIDIVEASVSQIDTSHLQLKMTVAGNIPSGFEETHYVAYLWQFDTDRNPSTSIWGFMSHDIGVDVVVRIFYDIKIRGIG